MHNATITLRRTMQAVFDLNQEIALAQADENRRHDLGLETSRADAEQTLQEALSAYNEALRQQQLEFDAYQLDRAFHGLNTEREFLNAMAKYEEKVSLPDGKINFVRKAEKMVSSCAKIFKNMRYLEVEVVELAHASRSSGYVSSLGSFSNFFKAKTFSITLPIVGMVLAGIGTAFQFYNTTKDPFLTKKDVAAVTAIDISGVAITFAAGFLASTPLVLGGLTVGFLGQAAADHYRLNLYNKKLKKIDVELEILCAHCPHDMRRRQFLDDQKTQTEMAIKNTKASRKFNTVAAGAALFCTALSLVPGFEVIPVMIFTVGLLAMLTKKVVKDIHHWHKNRQSAKQEGKGKRKLLSYSLMRPRGKIKHDEKLPLLSDELSVRQEKESKLNSAARAVLQ